MEGQRKDGLVAYGSFDSPVTIYFFTGSNKNESLSLSQPAATIVTSSVYYIDIRIVCYKHAQKYAQCVFEYSALGRHYK